MTGPPASRQTQSCRRLRRWRRALADDRGTAAAELAILTPPVMLLAFFAVFVGRYATTSQDVISASRDAARAAAVRQEPGTARADGIAAATTTLQSRGVSCQGGPSIEIDVSQLRPGGQVRATVTCTVSLSDVAGLGVGSRTVDSTSVAVVDTYRGGE
jgi:Flp pilus assembly protein TadG